MQEEVSYLFIYFIPFWVDVRLSSSLLQTHSPLLLLFNLINVFVQVGFIFMSSLGMNFQLPSITYLKLALGTFVCGHLALVGDAN